MTKNKLMAFLILTSFISPLCAGDLNGDDDDTTSTATAKPDDAVGGLKFTGRVNDKGEFEFTDANGNKTYVNMSTDKEAEDVYNPVRLCSETSGQTYLGGEYKITSERNDSGHFKVIGRDGSEGYLDPETANGQPRGVYIQKNGYRFYPAGNCDVYPNEGPGAINDKWIGGPLHADRKYKNTTESAPEKHFEGQMKKIFGNLF